MAPATEAKAAAFEGWAMVEVFGHRRLGGMVRDVEMFGGRMCRIDEPELPATTRKRWKYGDDGGKEVEEAVPARQARTHFYGAGSIFSLTPCTQEVVLAFLKRQQVDEAPAVVDLPARLQPMEDTVVESDDGGPGF